MAQQKWLVDGPKTIDIESARSLKISLLGGQIDVVAHDEPGVRIEVHSVTGKELRVELDGDRVEIDHPQIRWESFLEVFRSLKPGSNRADISVMVPREATLKLGAVSSSVLVSGVESDVDLSTVNGDVVADGLMGDLKLNAVNGELTVRGHRGAVRAHTVNGDITVQGALRKFSSDGVSGDVYVDATGVPGEINVKTVSGSVTARVDEGTAVKSYLNTVAGRIQLDDHHIQVRGTYTAAQGTPDADWVDFRASTVSGDITLLHTARAAAAPAGEAQAAS